MNYIVLCKMLFKKYKTFNKNTLDKIVTRSQRTNTYFNANFFEYGMKQDYLSVLSTKNHVYSLCLQGKDLYRVIGIDKKS